MNNQQQQSELKLVFNIPNAITAVRIVLSPVIALFLLVGEYTAAGIVIIVAAATDGFDGYTARKFGQSSVGGVLFDLVADQILFIPNLIIALSAGLFSRADDYMFWNPYTFAIVLLSASVMQMTAVLIYIWKRRRRDFDFPYPPMAVKAIYWFWLAPALVAVFGIGSDLLLAVLMYMAVIYTVIAGCLYFKKGFYLFTA